MELSPTINCELGEIRLFGNEVTEHAEDCFFKKN